MKSAKFCQTLAENGPPSGHQKTTNKAIVAEKKRMSYWQRQWKLSFGDKKKVNKRSVKCCDTEAFRNTGIANSDSETGLT